MGVDMFPWTDKPTSTERLGAELADEQVKWISALRKVRQERGLSVAEVAEKMKVDPAQVSRFESGSTNPTMATIRRYAKAVGAAFRIDTRSWSEEQTIMVKRSTEAWEGSVDSDKVVTVPRWGRLATSILTVSS